MQAKKAKMKNLYRQRAYIMEKLQEMVDNPPENGSTEYLYEGAILKENIKYFREEEGYEVVYVGRRPDNLKPVYAFNVSKVTLSEAEEQEAKESYDNESKKCL